MFCQANLPWDGNKFEWSVKEISRNVLCLLSLSISYSKVFLISLANIIQCWISRLGLAVIYFFIVSAVVWTVRNKGHLPYYCIKFLVYHLILLPKRCFQANSNVNVRHFCAVKGRLFFLARNILCNFCFRITWYFWHYFTKAQNQTLWKDTSSDHSSRHFNFLNPNMGFCCLTENVSKWMRDQLQM